MSPFDSPARNRYNLRPRKRKPDTDHPSTSSSSSKFTPSKTTFGINNNNNNSPRLDLQFFVRIIHTSWMTCGVKTLVLQANLGDTVENIHRKIQLITGIHVSEQRLIYRGRQLQLEQTLKECGIQNDSGLQLVGRMRSTGHPKAWRLISDFVHAVELVSKNGPDSPFCNCDIVKFKLNQFMMLPLDSGRTFNCLTDKTDYYKIFMYANLPKALVMLYRSPEKPNKECADECIRRFVGFGKGLGWGEMECVYCVRMVLEFCRLLLTSVHDDDALYLHCRSSLGAMLRKVEVANKTPIGDDPFIAVEDVFPFLKEVGERLVKDLAQNVEVNTANGTLLRDVCDFSAFLKPVMLNFPGRELAPTAASSKGKGKGKVSNFGDRLFYLFNDLLTWIDKCMDKCMSKMMRIMGVQVCPHGSSHYLVILKELRKIAVLYPGAEDRFWDMMRKNNAVVRALVVLYATRDNDHRWLLKHKDVLDFNSRRHLAMLMLPKVTEDYEQIHEMLIDRSQLLAESFEYIYNAEASSLQAGLFMEFKNEKATGPGVLREWFCLVCQALFDPQNALFVASPLDRRRFYPNPASKVDPLHLRYFRFTGRVIALALMHKIQIGSVLDRVFFLQLAGRCVSVEDIKDADPCIYNSCKQILEMDPEFVDSDGLALTFVTEVEELGSTKVVELCYGGKNIVVNSKNRKDYVHLIVQQRFVTSITEQVSSFAKGFADILRDDSLRTTFFESLELEDLDWMLHGSGDQEISIEDWKAHTSYHGYRQSDPQIVWFWEVVEQLNVEQKKTLLFFWTSVKYLPVEGFRGLVSRLFIYKSLESQDRLPSSHTCFHRLCIPTYPTKDIMQERLRVITQEHVGCSFGTW